MLVITGGAGFIGSNLVLGLNGAGRYDLVIVDDLTNASKVGNIDGARFVDYVDKEDFRTAVRTEESWTKQIRESSTTEPVRRRASPMGDTSCATITTTPRICLRFASEFKFLLSTPLPLRSTEGHKFSERTQIARDHSTRMRCRRCCLTCRSVAF